ncbi:MAG TPA: hypothetical protein VFP47_06330 [Pyrinomonadaceae bacterium]|nr:hypothetical protein [Pyrinomonadaceae bacterium]
MAHNLGLARAELGMMGALKSSLIRMVDSEDSSYLPIDHLAGYPF